MFILNILVEQTKFQYNGGSISNRNLTINASPSQLTFMTLDNVKSFTQALTHTSSEIHGIRKSICTPIHVFKKIYFAFFLSKIECCNVVSEGILKFLLLFVISTLSNNDVIHGVPGYFKYR